MASVAALISSGASKASLRILSRASTSFSTIETTGMSLLTRLDCTRCNSIFADLVSGFSIRWLTFGACETFAVFWRVLAILCRTKTSSVSFSLSGPWTIWVGSAHLQLEPSFDQVWGRCQCFTVGQFSNKRGKTRQNYPCIDGLKLGKYLLFARGCSGNFCLSKKLG